MKEPISYKYIKIAFGILIAITFYSTSINIYSNWSKLFITTPFIIFSILPILLQISILFYIIKIKDIRKFIIGFAIMAIFGMIYEYLPQYNVYQKVIIIISLFNIVIIAYLINTKDVRNWVSQNNNESKKTYNRELTFIFIIYIILLIFFSWIYKEQIKAKLSVENTYNIK